MDSVTTSALNQGVVHLPDTSLPWSDTPERNVYLAGHRLGWPGTGSHLVFYHLNEVRGGERITLRGRERERYHSRVIDTLRVWPEDRWVTGRVGGRDLLPLQTWTPMPSVEKRLSVRAERIQASRGSGRSYQVRMCADAATEDAKTHTPPPHSSGFPFPRE